MPRDKKNCLTRTSQFNQVYSRGRSWATPNLVVKALPNRLEYYRCGVVVSKKIGTAVVRNKVRRRLREIIRKMTINPGWDIIFVARAGIVDSSFAGLKEATVKIIKRAGLGTERYERACPGDD